MTTDLADQLHRIDRLVGDRIARRRRDLGVSQGELAAALGVSFQQVQKYERAANRISSSRLWAAARLLGVEIGDLFEGAERQGSGPVGDHQP